MTSVQLSSNVQCPIPVALPAGEHYEAGIPLFGIGNTRQWNAERFGEFYTGWNFQSVAKKMLRPVALGTEITFLGVTTEDTLGQTICSVQGAGVVNISGSALASTIDAKKLNITTELYVVYNFATRSVSKITTLTNKSKMLAIKIGKVHHVYASEIHPSKVVSVDVKLNTGYLRSMKVMKSSTSAPQRAASTAAYSAPVSMGGGPAPPGDATGDGDGGFGLDIILDNSFTADATAEGSAEAENIFGAEAENVAEGTAEQLADANLDLGFEHDLEFGAPMIDAEDGASESSESNDDEEEDSDEVETVQPRTRRSQRS